MNQLDRPQRQRPLVLIVEDQSDLRELYAQDVPFIEKWRQAMRYLEEDRPYQKVWLELTALSWNRPELRAHIARVDETARAGEGRRAS